MKYFYFILILAFIGTISCNSQEKKAVTNTDSTFSQFEDHFLDQYWKQYTSSAIQIGYGKYYENLVVPDSAAFAGNDKFSKEWLDSLNKLDYKSLNDNNKISFNIIKNQLESDVWYMSVFKQQQWDATIYNLSNECYYLIHQPYAGLDERLRTLSKRLTNADLFYAAALKMLYHPTRESVGLSAMQNKGGLSVFGTELSDSIKSSHLNPAEIDTLNSHIAKTTKAISGFVGSLNAMLNDPKSVFKKYSIGKDLYNEKFKFDLVTDFSPEEIYVKAKADQKRMTTRMYKTADSLWTRYMPNKPKPKDSMLLIQSIINVVSLQHANAKDFYDSLRNQVTAMKKFIIVKDLFAFDTTYPIVVRIMPPYERGFSIASAEFTPPYQKKGDTYYNIDDVTLYPKEKLESTLREMNNYTSQLISIHEAMPGHCLQGIYNNLKSPDVLRSVFQNTAMIEGWAVYAETMMVENGWSNYAQEMQLMHDKLKLRELGNVIIDYEMQCLDAPKERIIQLLTKELFQTSAQAEEKYHRATLSQVQLCSYYTGSSAILSLREEYKKKRGNDYSLKDFHENFLKYGSSPVKYIRERMLN